MTRTPTSSTARPAALPVLTLSPCGHQRCRMEYHGNEVLARPAANCSGIAAQEKPSNPRSPWEQPYPRTPLLKSKFRRCAMPKSAQSIHSWLHSSASSLDR